MNNRCRIRQVLQTFFGALGFANAKERWTYRNQEPVISIVEIKEHAPVNQFTIVFGFYSPKICRLRGRIPEDSIAECNSSGLGFSLQSIGILPPTPLGWSDNEPDHSASIERLPTELETKYCPIFRQLVAIEQWIEFCETQLNRYPSGKGKYWTLMVDVMLILRSYSVETIDEAIRRHESEQDGKCQNKLEYQIQRQRQLLEFRKNSPADFDELVGDEKH